MTFVIHEIHLALFAADNATDAQALATLVHVLGPERGLALIGKCSGTEAILMTSRPKHQIIKTSRAEKYEIAR